MLLGLTAEGRAEKQIIECYPQVGPEALQTMFAFVAECTRDERVYGFPTVTREQAVALPERAAANGPGGHNKRRMAAPGSGR